MKKFLLILVILLTALPFSVKAENKTVVEGRYWNYLICGTRHYDSLQRICTIYKNFHFKGTVTLDGKEYNIFRDENEDEIAYLREEDNKIYLYADNLDYHLDFRLSSEDNPKEVMIYDFSCGVGDTFPCVGFDDMAYHTGNIFQGKVEGVGTIKYNGYEYLYQDFFTTGWGSNKETPYRNIEGIGNVTGVLPFPQFACWTTGMTKMTEYLLSVTDSEGNVIYKNDELSESLNHYIPTGLEWEYYETSGAIARNAKPALHKFSLEESDNERYPYAWKKISTNQWEETDIHGPLEYKGETIVNEVQAYLRQEDGKIYLSLDNYKVPENPYFDFYYLNFDNIELPRKILRYDQKTMELVPADIEPGEEIILYDFTAKVGDRYRTLIYGFLLTDVTVTKVNEDCSSPIGKVVEVLPDYYIDYYKRYPNYGEIGSDEFRIKYAEKIGNFYKGDYITLMTDPTDGISDGSYYYHLINNIYNKADHSTYYQGENHNLFAGIDEISSESPNNTSKLYDLHGREVANPLPGSIYIRDGIKLVAK